MFKLAIGTKDLDPGCRALSEWNNPKSDLPRTRRAKMGSYAVAKT